MKHEYLNKSLIEGIVRASYDEYIDATDEKVRGLVYLAIEKLSTKIPYINFNNIILQPINEIMTGGFIENSKLAYFLGVDNSQLEINSLKNDWWRKFKKRVAFAWKNRNANKKRRRKKKNQPEVKMHKEFDAESYNLNNLAEDLQIAFAENLCETSIIYQNNNILRIIGKDDFGSSTQIQIYLVISNDDVFKYITNKRKILTIDNGLRISAIEYKLNKVGPIFSTMIKIFNTLYFNINHYIPNQIFIESLLYNCPDYLFNTDAYSSFMKIINYLSLTSTKEFKSIANPSKTIYTDELCGNSGLGFKKLIDKLIDFKNQN